MPMPLWYESSAPKFDGKSASLTRFLRRIYHLGKANSLTDEEIIKATLTYVQGLSDHELWEQQREANGNDWVAFKDTIIELYPGAERKYSVEDLEILVEDQAAIPVQNLTQIGEYYRAFLLISFFLKTNSHLSESEIAWFFMQGFHSDFRRKIRERLRRECPSHDPNVRWRLEEIFDAAVFLGKLEELNDY